MPQGPDNVMITTCSSFEGQRAGWGLKQCNTGIHTRIHMNAHKDTWIHMDTHKDIHGYTQ